ncbi:MAG: aminotransferase class I/II-fold pyridoxal phosphate-dependent enzyme [Candidatus Marinimicrobia bacterium]|nr:aminotransferase class I/II-fold pyridoxal phosphate-dependent enzyme [Candidatus Neomarinimicrobiota bacterium]
MVTDGTYDKLPPLPAYYGLAEKYDGVLLLDEAHTLGILGKHGRGAFEHYGLDTGRLLLTGSLSKACGASGGFVSGPGRCIGAVRETCAYATTSAPSLPLVAAGIASIRFFRDHPGRIRDLQERCVDVKQRLVAMGFDVPVIPTPVAGIYLPGTEQAGALKEALKYAGIYPPLIRYPGKPDYFRFAFSSAHSDEDIDRLLEVLRIYGSQIL